MSKSMMRSREELMQAMHNLNVFNVFSEYEKKVLGAVQDNFILFNTSEEIVVEGECCNCMYIILSGMVSVIKNNAPIASLGVGEFVGEMAFFTKLKRSTTVVADEPTLTLRLTYEFMKTIKSDTREKIKDLCIMGLVERVQQSEQRLQLRKTA